jgi:putative nucleotidyltransferase with HDIG domain
MEPGPTQNYDDAELGRWKPHPVLAFVVRLVIGGLPPLLAIGFGLLAVRVAPPARLGMNRWVWLAIEIACSTVLLWWTSRLTRRLLPLSTLLRLTLFFPDHAPSRFAVALRTYSTGALRERIEQVQQRGEELTEADQHGVRLLELVAAISVHDQITRGHSERVQAYAGLIAKELGLPEADAAKLRWAALLHDVGKLHVPFEILNRDGRPTAEEWEVLSTHPAEGVQLAAPLAAWLGPWLDAIGQHHERWDGGGYPLGLAGEDIHYGARIVAVADTYDVITSARSYKKPMPAAAARAELTRCAGEQFDPQVVRAFLAVGRGRLRLTAGPLSALSTLPGLQSVPLATLASKVAVVAPALATAAAASVVGVALSLNPLAPNAHRQVFAALSRPLATSPATAGPGHPAGISTGGARAAHRTAAAVGHRTPAGSAVPGTPAPRPGSAAASGGTTPAAGPGSAAATPGVGAADPTGAAPGNASLLGPAPAPPAATTAAPAATPCAKARAGASKQHGANLAGCDLSGATLTGDYTGANLAGANLSGATLRNLDLGGAKLTGATLAGARIVSTSFNSAKLNGADFSNAVISHDSFLSAGLRATRFPGATVDNTSFGSAVLASADLSGMHAGGNSNSFPGADLTNASFRGADLTGASLVDATLSRLDVSGANLTGVNLSGAHRHAEQRRQRHLVIDDLPGRKPQQRQLFLERQESGAGAQPSGSSSRSNRWMRAAISSRIGRTAAIPCPAGSGRSQSS